MVYLGPKVSVKQKKQKNKNSKERLSFETQTLLDFVDFACYTNGNEKYHFERKKTVINSEEFISWLHYVINRNNWPN